MEKSVAITAITAGRSREALHGTSGRRSLLCKMRSQPERKERRKRESIVLRIYMRVVRLHLGVMCARQLASPHTGETVTRETTIPSTSGVRRSHYCRAVIDTGLSPRIISRSSRARVCCGSKMRIFSTSVLAWSTFPWAKRIPANEYSISILAGCSSR